MPPEGIKLLRHEDILSFEEIRAVVIEAVKLGINKVRLTGGEPLVRRGIIDLVEMLGKIEGITDYAMTTNGVLLTDFAVPLKKAGLHRLNISLDTLDPERFRSISRIGDLADVLKGIDAAVTAGFVRIKLNCVIKISPDEADARQVAEYGKKRGFEVRFIREMNLAKGRFWRVHGGDGGNCVECNRLRLSSDGKIYPCLFNDVSYPVRELGIEKALKMAIEGKPEIGKKSKRGIYAIGG